MPAQLSEFPIRKFGTVTSLQETTDMGDGSLNNANNVKLRPWGGVSGPPRYFRLWAIGSITNIYNTLDALTHPSGVGTLSDADLTVAVRIYRYGVSFLLFYSMPDRKGRGFFYMGNDASYTGPVDFDSGPPSYEVLGVGFDRDARWYGKRAFTQIFINNGVDDGLVAQLNRSKTPGKLRVAASNDRPGAPVISLVTPGVSTLIQAYWTIPGTNSVTFTANASTDTLTTGSPHNMVNGTIVRLTTDGTLPAGLSTGTDYYVIAATATTMKLSASFGGTGVNFTNAGSGTHTVAAYGTTRAGAASITFTANALNFPGITGDNKIKVAIVFAAYGGALSSTLTGSGNSADPYIYTIFTTTSGNTTDAVVSFVNLDAKILSILSASKSAADTTFDGANYGPEFLANGSGTGTSEGFTNKTATVYARYFDSGAEFLGYEGISSDISNTIIIDAATNSDIRVSVPVDPEAGAGRFDQIRVYLQFGEALLAQWNLMDEDNPISNASATGLFLGNAAADTLVSYSANQIVTASASTDFITGTTPTANNTPLILTSTATVPGGTVAYTTYYAIQATGNTFKVSLTPGGAAINLTTNGTGTITAWNLMAHGITDASGVTFSTSGGTLPAPLTATEYFALSTTTYTLKVATTVGGAAINITTAGTQPCTYTLTRKVVQLGTTTTIGQIMSVDQNRPLPHKITTVANEQTWRGGVTGFQDRLYVSKQALNDELAPEGANADAYERVESPKGTTGAARMTALYSDGFKIHIHTADGVTLIDPTDPSKRYSPPVVCGAINQSALTPWPGGMIYYLGADFQIYTISGLRYGKQQVEFAARDAAAFITERTNIDAALNNPDRVYMMPETASQMLWFFIPAPDSGPIAITANAASDLITCATPHGLRLNSQMVFPTLVGGAGLVAGSTAYFIRSVPSATTFKANPYPGGPGVNITTDATTGSTMAVTDNRLGFAFDFIAKGIVGAFDFPKVYDSCQLEPSRTEIPFCDEDGNLFFWDTRNQLDYGDNYGDQPAFTAHSVNTLPPVQWDGYGMVDDGADRYYPAATCVFETGFLDLGRASNKKAFAGLIWSCVEGSRGLFDLTFTTMSGAQTITRVYGDVGSQGFQQVHKILGSLNSTAVKIKVQVIYAEQAAWTVRSMTLLYRALRQV